MSAMELTNTKQAKFIEIMHDSIAYMSFLLAVINLRSLLEISQHQLN